MKNKKQKEPKPGFIKTLRYEYRALGMIHKELPGFIGLSVFKTIWEVATPYVLAFFSAQIVNELAGACDIGRIKLLVLLTVSITAFCGLCLAAVNCVLTGKFSSISWMTYFYIPHRKFFALDFADIDNTEVQDQLKLISGNMNWSGWGLPHAYSVCISAVSSVFKIAGAILLTVSFFTLHIPEGGRLLWLDNPLIICAILAVMVGVTFLAPFFSNLADAYWASAASSARKGNNAFGYFFFQLLEPRRAADARLYRIDRIASEICDPDSSDNAFGYYSPMARLARGPMGLLHAVSAVFSVLFTGFAYVIVCLKAWAGAYGVGSIAQYVAAITGLSQGVNSLASAYGSMRTNTSFLEPFFKLLDREETMYKGSLTTEKRRDRDFELEFRDVSFRYPSSQTYALRHVSLKFKVGERLALVGMNGSGKSTFIKLLCRLYDPTEGEILLNGINIRKYRYDDYMQIFSVVFQDFKLLPFTLAENVAAGESPDTERLLDAMQAVGLGESKLTPDTVLYKTIEPDGVEISGGEAQKIALARAVYRDAPFVILDEPTSALDPLAEADVYQSFDQIIKDRTAVYISHRLSSCRFCDRIAVFDNGSIREVGTHESLINDPNSKYHALWCAQAQYYEK